MYLLCILGNFCLYRLGSRWNCLDWVVSPSDCSLPDGLQMSHLFRNNVLLLRLLRRVSVYRPQIRFSWSWNFRTVDRKSMSASKRKADITTVWRRGVYRWKKTASHKQLYKLYLKKSWKFHTFITSSLINDVYLLKISARIYGINVG